LDLNFKIATCRRITLNEQILLMGELKTAAWQPNFITYFKDEKFILMFKRVPSARTKAEGDLLPIASTSSPTIG